MKVITSSYLLQRFMVALAIKELEHMLDILSVVIGLLGVCVSIMFPLMEYVGVRYKSEFYAYSLISQYELATQCRFLGIVYSFAAIGLYGIVAFNGVFYELQIVPSDRIVKIVFLIIFALFSIAIMMSKQVLAFQKSDRLEKRLRNERYIYFNVKSDVNSALIFICLGVAIALPCFGISNSLMILLFIGLIATSVQGVYCSYIYVYVQLHLRFFVRKYQTER